MVVESRDDSDLVWCLQICNEIICFISSQIEAWMPVAGIGINPWWKIHTPAKKRIAASRAQKQRYGYCGIDIDPFLLPLSFFLWVARGKSPCQVAPLYTKMDTLFRSTYYSISVDIYLSPTADKTSCLSVIDWRTSQDNQLQRIGT